MPSEKATAIVLRVTEFSETSCVVTLFTRELGKISGMAKGARRPKSPFEAALDLLAVCRIMFIRKSSDALDLLTEAKLVRRFRAACRDLSRLYAGYYVAELLNGLTDQYDSHPELFRAADDTLLSLDQDGHVAPLILRFELTALQVLGHLPSLRECVGCGIEVNDKRRIAFSSVGGGVYCEKCRVGKRNIIGVSAGAMRVLRQFAAPDQTVWKGIQIDPDAGGELRGVMNHYISCQLGRRPRMHRYLGILAN